MKEKSKNYRKKLKKKKVIQKNIIPEKIFKYMKY